MCLWKCCKFYSTIRQTFFLSFLEQIYQFSLHFDTLKSNFKCKNLQKLVPILTAKNLPRLTGYGAAAPRNSCRTQHPNVQGCVLHTSLSFDKCQCIFFHHALYSDSICELLEHLCVYWRSSSILGSN